MAPLAVEWPDFFEYAHDSNPNLADSSPWPSLLLTPDSFSIQIPFLRSDLLYEIEGSTDLEHWSGNDITEHFGSHFGGTSTREPDSPRYLRARVTHSPN